MARLVHTALDGRQVLFDRGTFDEWCVFVQRPDGVRHAPRDIEYFGFLWKYCRSEEDRASVYKSFCQIYDLAGRVLSPSAPDAVRQVAKGFGESAQDAEVHLAVIYAAMVAEENKAFTRLGKRVKRLGVCQLLLEGLAPAEAANWSRGKPWRQLDEECKRRGF